MKCGLYACGWAISLFLAGLALLVVLMKIGVFDSATEKHLRSQIALDSQTAFLPIDINGQEWEKAYVLCPYSWPDKMPESIKTQVQDLETNREGYNWVIYQLSDGSAVTHEVHRSVLDFCATTHDPVLKPRCPLNIVINERGHADFKEQVICQ